MLVLTVDVGHAITLGKQAYIRVEEKAGSKVRLAISSSLSPIDIIPHGIMPQQFNFGINGRPKVIERRMLQVAS
jgi:hypothetical protein